MFTILFWNFPCGDDRSQPEALAAMARMTRYHGVDVLVLAETRARPDDVLGVLNTGGVAYELAEDPPAPHPRIRFYTRFPSSDLAPFRADDRLDVRRLRWEDKAEVLLAAIHFYDRRNYTPEEQAALAPGVYRTLREAEIDAGHSRTVLFGDFNMNPFEAGMISFKGGFAAMSTRDLASRHSEDGPLGSKRFYNPSWSRLGRELPEAPGTHYFKNVSKPLNLFWHHLDQVLVRPALFEVDAFPDEKFQILTSVPDSEGGPVDLVRSTGKHWDTLHSDHLPIVFKLDPPEERDDA
jgi:hypothetical protein